MIRLEAFKFALSNAELSTPEKLQAALDDQHFLFHLDLIDLRSGPRHSRARLFDDHEVEIEIGRPSLSSVVLNHPELARGWAHAYAARGTGSLESSVAAAMLMQAVAVATGGILYDRVDGVFSDYAEQRRGADTLLAAIFDQGARLSARYPDANLSGRENGPAVVASRVSRY